MKGKQYIYYIVILFTLVASDILFALHINTLYLRTILIFLLSTFGLGYLLLRNFQEIGKKFWEEITYAVGLSIGYLMIGSLLMNLVLLALGVDKPLSALPVWIFINISIIFLCSLNIIRFRDDSLRFYKDFKMGIVDVVAITAATCFPLLMLIATSLLNNTGNNILVFIDIAGIAVYTVFLTLFSQKLRTYVFPYALFTIALSLLLMISMRTMHVMGTDILTEFRMFNSTISHGYWTKTLEHHAYNACISITVLPTVIALLLDIPKEYVFKLIMQIFFALTPVTVYLLCKKYTKEAWAFLATMLYISFPIFIVAMPMHIRQEIAFLFFGLMIYILFDDTLSYRSKIFMYMIFTCSMVISHYSTTYIAIGLFTIWYFSHHFFFFGSKLLIHLQYFKHRISIFRIHKRFNAYMLLMLIAFSFFWYTQVTQIGNNIVIFGSKTISNLSRIFSNDVRVDQTSVSNQFNVLFKQQNTQKLLSQYYDQVLIVPKAESHSKYDPKLYSEYKPVIINTQTLPLRIPRFYQISITVFLEIIKKIQKIFIIIGVLYLMYLSVKSKNKHIDTDFVMLSISAMFLLLAFMILPYVTIDYDLLRTTQQILIVLAYPSILGALFFIRIKYEWIKRLVISMFVILYFFTYTDFITQVIGGVAPSIAYYNYGPAYERLTVTTGEIQSAKWIEHNKKGIYLLHADQDSITRLLMSTLHSLNTNSGFFPSQIYKNSYVYLNKFNVQNVVTYRSFHGELLRIFIPLKFYGDNKDLIYSNKDSQIYY